MTNAVHSLLLRSHRYLFECIIVSEANEFESPMTNAVHSLLLRSHRYLFECIIVLAHVSIFNSDDTIVVSKHCVRLRT